MQGVQEDLLDWRSFHHFPSVHHPHPIGDAGDNAQVVGDVHDGRVEVAAQLGDQVQHSRLDGYVQGGGRLVHDQQRRVVEQGHGDDHALLLAAGDLVGIA